ncbi:MAG: hypothetical protein F4188_03130, partial [Chloroflexi bacterium]|nr:hypothetical protein [Chloroflexota bacterium]
ASGLDDTWLTWGVFAAMLICAAVTALQAFQFHRFGAGHIVLTWPAAMFIAITVSAVSAGGPEIFASLLVICSLVQIALAWWLPILRRIITPVVSGTVTMLIAVSVLPIAFDSVQDLPDGASVGAGPAIAVTTLLASVIVTLRATGRWRLIAPFIDFPRIQGIVSVNGIGMLMAGLSSTLPPMANSSYSLSLINLTGVAARRVGIGVAVVILFLAFFSKFAAILLTIPGPVVGAFLMLAMGMLFVSGWQTILRDGLDPRRVLVVALASALGLGLHGHPLMSDLFGEEIGALIGNGVTIGAIVAIVMTLMLEVMGSRRSRLEVALDMASLPAIDNFLAALAIRLGWDDASTLRLRSAGEETLATLLRQEDAAGEDAQRPRLVIVARPQTGMVELEFVATTRQENIEDQLAYLTDEAPVPTADDLSLRLLWYHASAVRHQKFHGVDIVTVQVEGSS